jgi:hypothetical protein
MVAAEWKIFLKIKNFRKKNNNKSSCPNYLLKIAWTIKYEWTETIYNFLISLFIIFFPSSSSYLVTLPVVVVAVVVLVAGNDKTLIIIMLVIIKSVCVEWGWNNSLFTREDVTLPLFTIVTSLSLNFSKNNDGKRAPQFKYYYCASENVFLLTCSLVHDKL